MPLTSRFEMRWGYESDEKYIEHPDSEENRETMSTLEEAVSAWNAMSTEDIAADMNDIISDAGYDPEDFAPVKSLSYSASDLSAYSCRMMSDVTVLSAYGTFGDQATDIEELFRACVRAALEED